MSEKDRYNRARTALNQAVREVNSIQLGDVCKENADELRQLSQDMEYWADVIEDWEERVDE